MLRSTSTTVSLMILTSALTLPSFPCHAGVQGDLELLKTVALEHKANFESILTWKGDAFEERTSRKGDNYYYLLKNKCTFAYDQLQQAVRWNRDPQESRFLVDGKLQRSLYANYNAIMIKARTSYDYKVGGLNEERNVIDQLVISEPERLKNMGNHGLDPRYFFFNHGLPVYDMLMHLYNNANNPELMKTYVKREENRVIVTTEGLTKGQDIIEKWTFNLSTGGNLVEYYNKGPRAENTREYEYEEKSGVWVLKSYKSMNVTHHEDGDLRSIRLITWSNSVVNVPFDQDEFTLDKLGVRRGALVSDHKRGMGYIYGGFLRDSELLEVVDAANMPVREISSTHDMVPVPNDVDTAMEEQVDNEPNVVLQPGVLSETTPTTLDTGGIRKYTYGVIAATVIGLGAIAYVITRRFGKE